MVFVMEMKHVRIAIKIVPIIAVSPFTLLLHYFYYFFLLLLFIRILLLFNLLLFLL
jgi:hypothetical protein